MVKSRVKRDKLSTHKDKAWTAFSIYIRTRDCLKTTGHADEGKCVTCGRSYTFKQLQAGHWIPGRNNAVLFSEEGVHAQCNFCNGHKKGNPIEYWKFMEVTYGRELMDRLIFESHQTVIYKSFDYDEIAERYKLKTKELLHA